ncbi:DUF1302 domain-containing protein [Variovorax sp. LT1R16]|uniref:DUF1302 domain-containing protein n=1 Tax=Variovorax sp. LT1R16 TaxID=3443728 RepID=UPI003F456D15
MKTKKRRGIARHRPAMWAAASCVCASNALAFEFETGNPDLSARWDNTLKYSAAARVKGQSSGLTSLPNTDDGNRNFSKGLISNRVDLLSELDVVYAKRYGLRLSAASWYDDTYNRSNDNPGLAGGAFPNQVSAPYNEFTATTRRLHGRSIEALDAFVFGGFDLGQTRATVRLGNHSLVWGESLFFGANAVAGGMNPVDVIKLLSVPNTQFKEAIRPVPQVSAQWQLNPSLSFGAFYQFRWEPNRLPAAGSYFSGFDSNPEGGERLLLAGPGSPFAANAGRLPDQRARNSGQGGVQVRWQGDESDFGLYLIRFHQRSHQQITNIGLASASGGGFIPGPIGYRLAYQEGITALGASASRTFGDVNLAAEVSVRHNQDLASTRANDTGFFTGLNSDNSSKPAYAVGKTAHVNVNAMWTMPNSPLYNEASLVAEVAWNRVMSVTRNANALDPNATRDAVALRALFEPAYRQVLPGLDLSVPVGLGYSPKGSRSMALGAGALPPSGGGDFTLGVKGTYLGVWHFSLAYTHFLGGQGPLLDGSNSYSYRQYLKDRDFIALSVRRAI